VRESGVLLELQTPTKPGVSELLEIPDLVFKLVNEEARSELTKCSGNLELTNLAPYSH
jgi:hypothetical protein